MSQLITKIKQIATAIKTETRTCANTAIRVGGLFEDIAEELEFKSEISYVDTELREKADQTLSSAKTYTDIKVAGIVNSSPETLDTLNELAAALGNDPNFATTIATQIGQKVDKIAGKGLSSNDYTTTDKDRLAIIYNAINGITPLGSVQAFAGTVIPAGWKLCDGSSLNKADYVDLYAVLGNVFGNTSTSFKLPDLRGEFIRGYSAQRYVSGEGYIDSEREFGSTQRDALQNITGGIASGLGDRSSSSGAFYHNGANTVNAYLGGGVTMLGVNFDASRVARTAQETRPHNVALNYIIKVQHTLSI